MASFEYVSDLGLNLHHVLYAAASAGSDGEAVRRRAQPLPAELTVSNQPEFARAVGYYRHQFAGADLLSDPELVDLKAFLALGRGATPPGWQEVFHPLRPLYADTDWPAHDELNRAWSAQVAERMDPLLPEIVDELQRLFRDRLPADGPIRVDTVWVGQRTPAYTTVRPLHLTCSTTDPQSQDWAAVEVVLHEASHGLATPLRHAIRERVDPWQPELRDLWHAALFHLTGEAVRRALAKIGVAYRPYAHATGLFDRAWPYWRTPVAEAWADYLDGTAEWDEACARMIASTTKRAD